MEETAGGETWSGWLTGVLVGWLLRMVMHRYLGDVVDPFTRFVVEAPNTEAQGLAFPGSQHQKARQPSIVANIDRKGIR